ncbi:hypothetical protein [Photobacterium sp. 1_MG-2023]|uniref:hypothetical protein n=1 Tax=Photobacterium sp. 1_MG-2023 TaxID=3062646 RepID=UPI0026E1A53D|nr:hypothetical protein [Photobacterium sp. 1_MG-2023]MDO6706768.1 hypothetical protein [Photobacterium sp. 1_MG-2023]
MAKGEFCEVKDFKPSPRTLELIDQMNHIQDMSSVLQNILSAAPSFQILMGRNTYAYATAGGIVYNTATYDWNLLEEAFKGIGKIKRDRLTTTAGFGMIDTHGEERKFWECVYNAL